MTADDPMTGIGRGVDAVDVPDTAASQVVQRRRWVPFVASLSLIVILAAAGAPLALYPTYRSENGFTDTNLAVVTFAYLLAVVLTLIVFGRLSDYLGRRRVGQAALIIAVAGVLMLAYVHDPNQLLVGRVLQGVACGLAPSCLGAYVSETSPPQRSWLPAVITGSGFMIGISAGAIGSGALVEYAPHPRQLAFFMLATSLVVCMGLLALCPESVQRSAGVLTSLRPRLSAPAGTRKALMVACLASAATWPIGGFYQAFAPTVANEYLGAGNALVGAVVFASALVLNPLGGALVGRRASAGWIRAAMALFCAAVLGLVGALYLSQVGTFIGAGLLVGLAQGVAATCAMSLLLRSTGEEDRAGVLATVYVVSYGSTTLAVAVAAGLTTSLGLDRIMLSFAVFGVLTAVAAAVSTSGLQRRSRPA